MTGGAASATRFADGPAASPGFLLWHVTLAWQRAVGAALAPLELTHVQFVLLACTWWLSDHGEVPNQLTLAHQAGTDIKMTSQVVRKLEAKGLLAREIDPADTRARRLRPTAAGVRLAQRAIAAVEDADERFFGPEADAIMPPLQRIFAVVDQLSERAGRGGG
jgi:DNA-binding MarR family transcriptional regulator